MATIIFQPGDILYFGDNPEFETQFKDVAPRCSYCGYVLIDGIDTDIQSDDPLYRLQAMFNVPRKKGDGYGFNGRVFRQRASVLAKRHTSNPDSSVLKNKRETH